MSMPQRSDHRLIHRFMLQYSKSKGSKKNLVSPTDKDIQKVIRTFNHFGGSGRDCSREYPRHGFLKKIVKIGVKKKMFSLALRGNGIVKPLWEDTEQRIPTSLSKRKHKSIAEAERYLKRALNALTSLRGNPSIQKARYNEWNEHSVIWVLSRPPRLAHSYDRNDPDLNPKVAEEQRKKRLQERKERGKR